MEKKVQGLFHWSNLSVFLCMIKKLKKKIQMGVEMAWVNVDQEENGKK